MITPTSEYLEKLYTIQNTNIFRDVILNVPENEPIYKVNLEKRKIAVADFVGVNSDHEAEILYFQLPRFFDNMDLSKATCIIQFINANDEGGIYAVPYCDTTTLGNDTMIIPWVISGLATAYSGTIQFNIRFYVVDDNKKLVYNLGTQVAKTRVLAGLDLTEELADKYQVDADVVAQVYATLQKFADSNAWDWIDLPGPALENDEEKALTEFEERVINKATKTK